MVKIGLNRHVTSLFPLVFFYCHLSAKGKNTAISSSIKKKNKKSGKCIKLYVEITELNENATYMHKNRLLRYPFGVLKKACVGGAKDRNFFFNFHKVA